MGRLRELLRVVESLRRKGRPVARLLKPDSGSTAYLRMRAGWPSRVPRHSSAEERNDARSNPFRSFQPRLFEF